MWKDFVMEIDKELYNEIKEYCDLNGLKPRAYIHTLLKKAFMEDKYGKMPPIIKKPEKVTITVVEEKPKEEEPFKIELHTIEETPKEEKIEENLPIKEKEEIHIEKPIVKSKKRKL